MKQITLKQLVRPSASCFLSLFIVWGIYGLAMAALWAATPQTPWTNAAAWALAVVIGMALLIRMEV
jgi:hypothetical protein